MQCVYRSRYQSEWMERSVHRRSAGADSSWATAIHRVPHACTTCVPARVPAVRMCAFLFWQCRTRTCMRAFVNACTYARAQMRARICTRARKSTCVHASMHACVSLAPHACVRAGVHERAPARTYRCLHVSRPGRVHACTQRGRTTCRNASTEACMYACVHACA